MAASGFGPLNDAVLDLPDGMTLVFGPNEAGKSSWHGALYAGICGVRRGRGRPSASDQEFESRHRPWDGGPWQVRVVVVLADGRRVELTQDLAARSGTARDLATGRDVTSEILHEQVPDASRWLGLDRDAFRAVACVPQTALLQILDQPAQLAEHLQRAAATAGTDATAAEAIRRISDFLADQVGTDRAWTRPLARAKTDLVNAEGALQRAAQAHADTAQLREELRAGSLAKAAAEHRLRRAEAADARHRAEAAQDLWQQAADLSANYPEPPPQLAADDALAQQARVAVNDYRGRPDVPVLEGPSAADLEAELVSLPQAPVDDVVPAPEVEAAHETAREARATLQSVTALQPAFATAPQRTPADTSELRLLADTLAEPLPDTPTARDEHAGPLRESAHPARTRPWLGAVAAVAVILLVAGVAVAVAAHQPLGWAAVAAGTVAGAALVISVLREHTRQIASLRNQQATGHAGAMRLAAEQRLAHAQDRVTALGLPADPKALRELADADDRARTAAEQRTGWQQRRSAADLALQRALAQLSRELSARGAPVTTDPEEDFRRHLEECARRGKQAAQAARRQDLESRLQDRRQAEEQAADAATRRSAAEHALRSSARACGRQEADTADPEDLAGALGAWLEQREQALGQRQQAVEDYAVLQRMLDGGTVDGLQAEASRLARAAAAAADGLDLAEIADADLGSDPTEALRALRDAAQEARDNLTSLQTAVEVGERGIPSVAETEEAVAQVRARVGQLERLGRILAAAREILMQAQDRVHRSIAPQLAGAIAPHLGTVTASRYTEVTVDPDDLQVRIRASSGSWREAARLSHGTAEQVYLLLRAALAQYLVTTGEPCPLILDDPTAYADSVRTIAVLQVLHHISTERQIILFSHDTQVQAWARDNLTGPRDTVFELAGTPSAQALGSLSEAGA